MAKKGSTKKNNNETKKEVVEVVENVIISDEVNSKETDDCCVFPSLSKSFYMSELIAYEKAIRMLCIQYEKTINIDEMERRNQITPNREKFMRLSSLHKRVMSAIENNALKLENYED